MYGGRPVADPYGYSPYGVPPAPHSHFPNANARFGAVHSPWGAFQPFGGFSDLLERDIATGSPAMYSLALLAFGLLSSFAYLEKIMGEDEQHSIFSSLLRRLCGRADPSSTTALPHGDAGGRNDGAGSSNSRSNSSGSSSREEGLERTSLSSAPTSDGGSRAPVAEAVARRVARDASIRICLLRTGMSRLNSINQRR
eukprot:gnl/Spiro4/9059_TR4775_c0_g2_i1.p1 gnl/Spiro4/9059_TR4775_c0_g2~~gnl/Spiro4/9059_TR4775_c0_g2_i1.p1  ORF type:complete len:197 (+),score=16.92 gnl/Spiro4/9059_TR4775_c0_g2_i1:32-622(+)